MAGVRFAAPAHWQDWCSWLLGIWLCISPWTLLFDQEPVATRAAVVTGILLIVTEAVTLTAFRSWEEWFNALLGAWLIVAPWLLGGTSATATTNFVIVGVLVLSMAAYELWQERRAPDAPR